MAAIGFIGVGQMGTPMAANLLKAGFPVTVFDISPERIEALRRLGANPSSGPKDLASKSDVIITVLTYPRVVEEVILGKGGVVEGLKSGAIVIEFSSIDHETSIRVAKEVEARGGRFVEGALMGRPQEIEAREILFITAGKEETINECGAIFQAMGKKALRVGELGTAKLLKIANAMLNATETTAMYEVLAWSLRNGISFEGFLEVVRERRPSRANQLKRIVDGELRSQPTWTAKDVYHGLKIAEENEIPMPVLSAVHAMTSMAKSQNVENYTFSGMMWKFYERTLQKVTGKK